MGERQTAFLPSSRKVRLPDKAGKETDYWQYEFRRTVHGQRDSAISCFGPASLKGAFASALNAEGSPIAEDIYAVAKPLTVIVKDVPNEGRPDSYTGARRHIPMFGRTGAEETEDGRSDDLDAFAFGRGHAGRHRPARAGQNPRHRRALQSLRSDGTKQGQRAAIHLQPAGRCDADVREFPAMPFSYFDVETGRYRDAPQRSHPDRCHEGRPIGRARHRRFVESFFGQFQGNRDPPEGVFANITDAAMLGDESVHPERWLAGLGGLVCGYGLLAVGVNRWRRISGDSALLLAAEAAGSGQTAGCANRRPSSPPAECAKGPIACRPPCSGLVADMLDLPAAGLNLRRGLPQARIAGRRSGAGRPHADACSKRARACATAHRSASPTLGTRCPGYSAILDYRTEETKNNVTIG